MASFGPYNTGSTWWKYYFDATETAYDATTGNHTITFTAYLMHTGGGSYFSGADWDFTFTAAGTSKVYEYHDKAAKCPNNTKIKLCSTTITINAYDTTSITVSSSFKTNGLSVSPYSSDGGGGSLTITQLTKPIVNKPQVNAVAYEQHGKTGFTVHLQTAYFDAGTVLLIPTWTSSGGQDDLDTSWGNLSSTTVKATAGTHTYNGTTYHYKYVVNFSAHNNETGEYIMDFYYHTGSVLGGCNGITRGTFTPVSANPTFGAVRIFQNSYTSYTVYAQTDDTVTSLNCPTWTTAYKIPSAVDAQDDLIWHPATKTSVTFEGVTYDWECTINLKDHIASDKAIDSEYGYYATHLYAYNAWGSSAYGTSIWAAKEPVLAPKNSFIEYNQVDNSIEYGFTWPTLAYEPLLSSVKLELGTSNKPTINSVESWEELETVTLTQIQESGSYFYFNSAVRDTEVPYGKYLFLKLSTQVRDNYAPQFNACPVVTSIYVSTGDEAATLKVSDGGKFKAGLVYLKDCDTWKLYNLTNVASKIVSPSSK